MLNSFTFNPSFGIYSIIFEEPLFNEIVIIKQDNGSFEFQLSYGNNDSNYQFVYRKFPKNDFKFFIRQLKLLQFLQTQCETVLSSDAKFYQEVGGQCEISLRTNIDLSNHKIDSFIVNISMDAVVAMVEDDRITSGRPTKIIFQLSTIDLIKFIDGVEQIFE